jgi:hypothetical protein
MRLSNLGRAGAKVNIKARPSSAASTRISAGAAANRGGTLFVFALP